MLSRVKRFLLNKVKSFFDLEIDYDVLIDNLKYELSDEISNLHKPQILSIEETIECVVNNRKSLVRFGDGEIDLIVGRSIPFQSFSDDLRLRLIDVLQNDNPNILVSLPKGLYSSRANYIERSKKFWRVFGHFYRRELSPYIDTNRTYGNAEISIAYMEYMNYDFKTYFQSIINIWIKRDVVIVCGETVFKDIKFNIFDFANSVKYITVPALNAFNDYGNILNAVSLESLDKLIILIVGPTAKILAFDLTLLGYQVLDFGHIGKAYDWYCKKIDTASVNAVNLFFQPD